MMKIKKKILFVITKSQFGGAQRYVYDLATGLHTDAYEVAVAFGGEGTLKDKLLGAGIKTYQIKSFERDINFLKELRSIGELAKIIKEFTPDIIHLNSSKAGGTGALVARVLRVKKIVFTVHGWPFLERRNIFWKTSVWLLSWLTTLLAHKTILVSHNDRSHARMPFVEHKLITIHTGINTPDFRTKENARDLLLQKCGLLPASTALWILSIAEYVPNKNLLSALKAAHAIHTKSPGSLFYILIGSAGDDLPILEAYIQKHNLEEVISLAGFVDEARSYLKAFDIFLLPSYKEGLPYGLLEAGAAQIPCIASDVGGIPEVIESGKNGLLVDPNSIDLITSALNTVATRPDEARLYGKRLSEKICLDFSLEKMREKTYRIYNS